MLQWHIYPEVVLEVQKKKKGKKGTIAAVVRLKQYGNKKSRKSVRPRALCCSAHREQFI